MTILTQNVRTITGVPDNARWYFSSPLRHGEGGVITSREEPVKPVDGVLTVDLEPGPASVRFAGRTFTFTVPDTDTELWPLIQASVDLPPATPDQVLGGAVAAYAQAHPVAVENGDGTATIG